MELKLVTIVIIGLMEVEIELEPLQTSDTTHEIVLTEVVELEER